MRTFGVERERFIVNSRGKIVPMIGKLLPYVRKIAHKRGLPEGLFGFELFAGQIEDRTLPCRNFKEIRNALSANDGILYRAADDLNLTYDYSEFIEAEKITVFKVNPFSKRHKKIWASISNSRRISASIVAAVHIHISASEEEAVRILNSCRKDVVDRLISIGDHSQLRRINNYRLMAETNGIPPLFRSFTELTRYIESKGGEKNVWDLVRYKPSTKTVEFRMFGATQKVEEIIEYIKACLDVFKA